MRQKEVKDGRERKTINKKKNTHNISVKIVFDNF